MTERETGDDPRAESAGSAERAAGEAPHLDESIRRIRAAASETLRSGVGSSRALRRLVLADLALARSASGRALAWAAVAVVFGASAWLLTMGAVIALLEVAGLSWLAAISITALFSLLITAVAAWRVVVFFEYASLRTTRRQLSRLGLFRDDEDDEDDRTPAASPPETAAR